MVVVAGALSGMAQPRDLPRQELSVRSPQMLAAHVVQPAASQTQIMAASGPAAASDELTTVVRSYCRTCHNDRTRNGNLSLESFEVASVAQSAQTADIGE